MDARFVATALTCTAEGEEGQPLRITLADAAGRTATLRLTAELAMTLCQALGDFAGRHPGSGAIATKMPSDYAVGSGRHENVVLVRFERDAPYGLEAEAAAELGRALIEAAGIVGARPARALQ